MIKKEVLDKLQSPHYKTYQGISPDGCMKAHTEDVYFCEQAKEAGFKIGCHTGIMLGHIDTSTDIIY